MDNILANYDEFLEFASELKENKSDLPLTMVLPDPSSAL